MRTHRFVIGIALALTSLVWLVPPATGAQGLIIHCHAAGTIGYVDGSPLDAWTVSGQGSCEGNLGGTYFLQFAGSGTSRSLGLCDSSLLVTNLNLLVSSTLTNAESGQAKTYTQRWKAPITTYPIGTPFVVEHVPAEVPVGAGIFFNHIFANCAGSPVGVFDWTWQT